MTENKIEKAVFIGIVKNGDEEWKVKDQSTIIKIKNYTKYFI